MGLYIQMICDNPSIVEACVSKFTETSPSIHSANDRAEVAKKITDLREKAAFHGWKQQPNGDWFCPACSRVKR